MVIAALVVFGALLAAWLVAPAERARGRRPSAAMPDDSAAVVTEGLAEAA